MNPTRSITTYPSLSVQRQSWPVTLPLLPHVAATRKRCSLLPAFRGRVARRGEGLLLERRLGSSHDELVTRNQAFRIVRDDERAMERTATLVPVDLR